MNNPPVTAFALIIIFNIRNAIIANGVSISSASVDTCICVGRYEHLRRSMRMTKVGSMKRKRDGVNEGKKSVKRKKERCKRGERGVRGYGRDAIPS